MARPKRPAISSRKAGSAWCWPVRISRSVVQFLVYANQFRAQEYRADTSASRLPAQSEDAEAFCSWPAKIDAGRIKQLFIFGGDPVYNAPRALTQDHSEQARPVDWADLQKKVPEVVRLGYHEDATSSLSHWHVPMAHYLEAWGDARDFRRRLTWPIQPMILPLFGGLSEIELLNALLGGPKVDGPELVQANFPRHGSVRRFCDGVVEIFA